MRDVPDYMLEPPDPMADVLADEAREQAEADAWKELLDDGDQVPVLEDYSGEDAGEAFDLIRAYRADNQADLTSAALRIAAKLEAIAEEYLK